MPVRVWLCTETSMLEAYVAAHTIFGQDLPVGWFFATSRHQILFQAAEI